MDYKMIYLARRNPSVSPEDWPRHWRSHPKVVSQFPVVGAAIQRLRYCARVYAPQVGGTPVDLPLLDTEFDGAAIVASPHDTLRAMNTTPEVHEKIMEDERRVFGDYTHNSALHGRETLVLGGAAGDAAVLRFLRRSPDMMAEDFAARWAGLVEAADRAVAAGKVVRYVHNTVFEPRPAGHNYDGIAETWFATAEDAARSLTDPGFADLTEGYAKIAAPGSVTLLTQSIYAWPRD